MNRNKFTAILMALCMCLSFMGAGWFDGAKVTVDTENNKVYQYRTADEIVSEFKVNPKVAKAKYDNQPVLLTGQVKSVGKDGKYIMVTGLNNTSLSIECTCDKSLRSTAKTYKAGTAVAVYGSIEVGLITGDIYLIVDKITTKPASALSSDMYYLLDGTEYNKRNAVKVTLNKGYVEYYIPPAWANEKIQHNVKEENLGTMEGYQYVLNKLSPADPVPESLFVCYFDNSTQLAFGGDSDETKLIEKAIVENILGNVGIFPTKKTTTYYGAEYNYYDGVYKNPLEAGDGYRCEFIFQADGEDGIVVVLYVYREAKHVDDVLFLTRFLEVK
jgi:hypothetical protein